MEKLELGVDFILFVKERQSSPNIYKGTSWTTSGVGWTPWLDAANKSQDQQVHVIQIEVNPIWVYLAK